MKASIRIILIGVAVLSACLPLKLVAAQNGGANIRITQVDDSKFPQVTVYVSVTDASGEPLAVDPGQIQVSENGQLVQPQAIGGEGEIGPLTTLLVMDVSGSMNDAGKLAAAKSAAQAYVEQMRPGDQAGLLTFNTKVTYRRPLTTDHQMLIRAIDSLSAKNDTRMFDALEQAVQILQDVSGRKAIIVLTDGLDNRSTHTAKQVIQAIGGSGLSISTIGLGDPAKLGTNSGLDEAALQSLAEQAGGAYGYANNPDELLNLYERYGRALQSEYGVTYTSPSTLRDGLSRGLTVSLGQTASAQTKYNPGGVLPEVSQAASWRVFLGILIGLVALLAVPMLVNYFSGRRMAGARQPATRKQKSRIHLK
jgi:VWFA-related protein